MGRSGLMQFRRGTAAQWTATNPVLAAGEPGYVTDTNVTKVGDGVTPFDSLPSVATYTGHDAIYVHPGVMGGGTAAFTPNNTNINFSAYWAFDATTPEIVSFEWAPPMEWEAFVGRIGFLAPLAGSDSVRWEWSHLPLALGGNPTNAKTVVGTVDMAGPAGFGSGWTYGDVAGSVASPVAINPLATPIMLTTIRRVADHANDTMSGDAGLVIATMTRVPV